MDAIMLALVAVALANADGRTGLLLSDLLAARNDRRRVVAIAFGAFIANALIAAIAGAALNRMVGQGIVSLLIAFATLSAAAALLWRGRLGPPAEEMSDVAPAVLAVRMLALQFGNRSHFLIGALAATSGAGLWAAAGGLVGWILALLPFLAFGPALAAQRSVQVLRYAGAAILVLWGVRAGMAAFGL